MFIAVVIQLRGLACGVILTTQMSSMVLAFFGFASALLLSKPGAPTTFSSTSRYLSMFMQGQVTEDGSYGVAIAAAFTNISRFCKPIGPFDFESWSGMGKWFFTLRHLVEEGSWDRFRASPVSCARN